MDVSKLALSLLIPDLRQLGHVHFHWFIRLTVRRAEGRRMTTDSKQQSTDMLFIYC